MKFKYQGKTKEGENQVGIIEAGNKDAAVNILATHNVFTLSLEEAEGAHWYERIAGYFFGRVKRRDLVVFARQLATLLEARVPLNNSLRILYEQTAHPRLKEAALQISEDIDAGLSFSQTLERQPDVFSRFFVSMVRSAEITGNLQSVAGFLADYLEREYALITKARSALIYPVIVIGLFIVVAFILVAFVLPQIGPIFVEAGVALPFFSSALLNLGGFLGRWWAVLLLGTGVAVVMVLDYFQTPEGMATKDELKIHLPIIRKIYLPLTITHIANTASMLLRGGIPAVQAMEIIGETTDNVIYREIFHEIAENVRQGQPLSSSTAKYSDYFPAMFTQMLAVGETAGQLETTFSRLSNFYGREADTMIDNIVELIQPILIVGIGGLVGLLFASVLLPLYQLIGSIH
ncbi:MAG: type II secretion system F family protein [Candidatus Liptonbacteria bacterium]|nr:type II secretion system F family protein [Candidatus Liptonbacteria bacterium]